MPEYEIGSVSIIDWTGYPKGYPKPIGPFRLLEGSEYDSARKIANAVNAALRKSNPSKFKGTEIHELKTVKFGGSPTALGNKFKLDPLTHRLFNRFWDKMKRDLRK